MARALRLTSGQRMLLWDGDENATLLVVVGVQGNLIGTEVVIYYSWTWKQLKGKLIGKFQCYFNCGQLGLRINSN